MRLSRTWGTRRAKAKLRWGQRLSGIDPDSRAGALSLMCVAVRTDA